MSDQELGQAGEPLAQINPFDGISNRLMAAALPAAPPRRLCHYTSSAGLQGILESKSVWFSDAGFMNDGSEIQYGIRVFEIALDDLLEGKPERHAEVGNKLKDVVRQQSGFFRPVIFCLSDGENLLNQWRDYGKDITPYSIAFDSHGLLQNDAYSFRIAILPLIYDQDVQLSLMRALTQEIYDAAVALPEGAADTETKLQSLMMLAAVEVAWMISCFKNPAFEAEREWRMLSFMRIDSPEPSPSFRSSPLGVVPYYVWKRTDGAQLPIVSVTVGPTPYAGVTHSALRMFLDRNGHTDIEAWFSTIPIRR